MKFEKTEWINLDGFPLVKTMVRKVECTRIDKCEGIDVGRLSWVPDYSWTPTHFGMKWRPVSRIKINFTCHPPPFACVFVLCGVGSGTIQLLRRTHKALIKNYIEVLMKL